MAWTSFSGNDAILDNPTPSEGQEQVAFVMMKTRPSKFQLSMTALCSVRVVSGCANGRFSRQRGPDILLGRS